MRGAQQRDAELLGLVAELAQGGLLALLGFFLQGLDAVAVLVALEHRGDRRHQLLDEALHVVAEGGSAPAGQVQQARVGGVVEVPHVAPVGWGRALVALFLQQAGDDLVAAAAGVTEHEQVVTLAGDVEPEADRVDRAGVDVGGVELRQFGGAFEAERIGRAGGVQAFRRKRCGNGHGRASHGSSCLAPS